MPRSCCSWLLLTRPETTRSSSAPVRSGGASACGTPAGQHARSAVFQAMVQIDGAGAAEAEARMTSWSELASWPATAALEAKSDKGAGLLEPRHRVRLSRPWKEAAQDYLERAEVDPKEMFGIGWGRVLPSAWRGMRPSSRGCQLNRRVFRGTDNATCGTDYKNPLMLPGIIQPAVLPLCGGASVRTIRPCWAPWAAVSLALAAHRAGDHAKAVTSHFVTSRWACLNKVPGSFDYSNACPALSLLILALAESKLRQPEQAWQSFAEAAELIPSDLRTLGDGCSHGKATR